VKYDAGSYVTFNSQVYELAKFSFTVPGSHKIDNFSYPTELQLYHKSSETGKILVISVLIDTDDKETKSMSFFNSFIPFIPKKSNKRKKLNIKNWNVYRALPSDKAFYTYEGSLLFPPCKKKITWIVMDNSVNMNKVCYDVLKSIIKKNNRPIQKRNRRSVYYNENRRRSRFAKRKGKGEEKGKKEEEHHCQPKTSTRIIKVIKTILIIYFIVALLVAIVYIFKKYDIMNRLFAYLDTFLIKYIGTNLQVVSTQSSQILE